MQSQQLKTLQHSFTPQVKPSVKEVESKADFHFKGQWLSVSRNHASPRAHYILK